MHGGDDGLWRTLARIYTAIAACGVCVPLTASIPVLAGFDSFAPTLVFGAAGVGLAGGVTFLVDAHLAAASARRRSAHVEPPEPGERVRAGLLSSGETGARPGK